MATFVGTGSGESIYSGYVSSTVDVDPPGSPCGQCFDASYGTGGGDHIEGGGDDFIYTGAGNDPELDAALADVRVVAGAALGIDERRGVARGPAGSGMRDMIFSSYSAARAAGVQSMKPPDWRSQKRA
jgi:hypothetical protein